MTAFRRGCPHCHYDYARSADIRDANRWDTSKYEQVCIPEPDDDSTRVYFHRQTHFGEQP